MKAICIPVALLFAACTSPPQSASSSTATTSEAARTTDSDPDVAVSSGGVSAPGWTGRVDPAAAARGTTLAAAKFVAMGTGFHVTSGPAAIYWNPANTARGNYSVSSTFSQSTASAHPEGYGVFLSGVNLESPRQGYLYFLVRQDGKFLINHRADDNTVHKIVDWTANGAIQQIQGNTPARNALEVRVQPDVLRFFVNGTEVKSIPRSVIDGAGPHSGTTGIAGIRVNHNLDVHVDSFAVTPIS